MENQIGLIIKVMLLSGVLSFLIKYAQPDILLSATTTNALILVFSPSLIMAVLLGARLIRAKRS